MDDGALKNLFVQEEPPARDAAFALTVLARIERRMFFVDGAKLVLTGVMIGVLSWALAPFAEALAASPEAIPPLAAAFVLGVYFLTESTQPEY